jgi:hypothetical protein
LASLRRACFAQILEFMTRNGRAAGLKPCGG